MIETRCRFCFGTKTARSRPSESECAGKIIFSATTRDGWFAGALDTRCPSRLGATLDDYFIIFDACAGRGDFDGSVVSISRAVLSKHAGQNPLGASRSRPDATRVANFRGEQCMHFIKQLADSRARANTERSRRSSSLIS